MAYFHKRVGYFYSVDPITKKMVYSHRDVAREMLGRPLLIGEVVHHIDENRANNSPLNLMVFKSQSDHAAFHHLSEDARDLLLLADGSYVCRAKPSRVCSVCGVAFVPSSRGGDRSQKYCSRSCSAKSKSIIPDADSERLRLELHRQMWDKPMRAVAIDYGVSDTAIKKKCIKHGIPRPGRGFWRKVELGILDGQSCPLP